MPRTPQQEQIAALHKEINVLKDELRQQVKIHVELQGYIKDLQTIDVKREALYNKQRVDFQKLALAYDTIRQVVTRTGASLGLDGINPLTIIKSTSTVFNDTSQG
jgi:hypothetical protein